MQKKSDPDLPFGAVPLRARSDPRLTALDFRVLVEIAHRDRLSQINGGDGCFAMREKLTAEVNCHPSRWSISVGRLVEFGYVLRRQKKADRREHTLTVLYQEEKIGCQGGNLFLDEIGCQKHQNRLPREIATHCEPTAIRTLREPNITNSDLAAARSELHIHKKLAQLEEQLKSESGNRQEEIAKAHRDFIDEIFQNYEMGDPVWERASRLCDQYRALEEER